MCANTAEAEKISGHLIKRKLAACVNTLPGVNSVYWWLGKVESAGEILLVAKTEAELLGKIIAEVKKEHSYKVPEIIALPICGGNADYLKWIKESVKS
jgi:periplasmic divalent cation tolerance protein